MFCVSSKIMITASSGARVTPASMPAHAEQRVAADGRREVRQRDLHDLARPTPPIAAPISSDGVKTPPTPPEPIVAAVATVLASSRSSEEEQRRVAVEDPVGGLEAVAVDLRQPDRDRADDRAADRHRRPRRAAASPRRAACRPRARARRRPTRSRRAAPIAANGRHSTSDSSAKRRHLVDRLVAEDRRGRRSSRPRPRRPPDRRAPSRRSRRRPRARRASRRSACCRRRRRRPPCRRPSGSARAPARPSTRRASAEAQAAPIWMIGPSRPSEPPRGDDGDRRGAARERRPQPHRAPAERDDLDHVGDAGQAPSRRRRSRRSSPPTRPPAAGIRTRSQRPAATPAPREDVVGAHEQPRQAVRQESEGDRAEAAEQARGRGEDEELGVGIAPEEAAEPRGPRRREAQASSFSIFVASEASALRRPHLRPPKKNACAQSASAEGVAPHPHGAARRRPTCGRSDSAAGRRGIPGCR